ncbi:MAG: microcin C transport system substrate-binding protein [Rubritalea sp.]|jgi:microcin C transport system substrate-binding protein
MKFLKSSFTAILLCSCVLTLTHCNSSEKVSDAKLYDLDSFIERYNKEVNLWVDGEIVKVKKKRVELDKKLSDLSAGAEILSEEDEKLKRKLERSIDSSQRDLEKFEFRKSLGGYFSFKSPEDIPADLVWEDGMGEPEIGDPKALKGGTYNSFFNDFPDTLRPFGPNANHSYRSYIYDEIEVFTIGIHPVTKKPIPGLANQWALSKDGRTVFYKLDPEARYSDGNPVRAKDFMADVYVRASQNVFDPYYEQYFKEQFANITVYDEMTLSITLPEKNPDMYYSTAMRPASPEFYSEYGPDYKERYQWRVPPTTGAYDLKNENINKGRSITMTRVKDWWAKDRKYYRYRFNVDQIRYLVILDVSKCYELFKIGEIDAFWIHSPNYWYEKTEIEPVFNGYIEKKKFYREWPIIPWGIYLNVEEGILKNKDVRIGLQHAMNFQKVNDQMFRGDYVRINQFSDGYGRFTNESIKARKFNPKLAREYFAKAGFTKEGDDRILRNAAGEKLSFSCTIRSDPSRIQMLSILQSEALDCGVQLKIDTAEASVAFAKTAEKRHESTFSAWSVMPPTPKYRQFFHSEAAFDETGARNKSSNNQNVFADERMDVLADQVRNARSYEELETAAHEAQQIIHDAGIFIPGVDRDFTAIGHWRWMKWPDSKTTKFSYPAIYEPMESYLYWIDEKLKKETLKARKDGKTFPEIEQVIDDYRKNN